MRERRSKWSRWAAVVAVLFVTGVNQPAQAQILSQLPGYLASDQYVKELDGMFQEWNVKRLELPPKSKLKDRFEDRLKKILSAKKYTYQDAKWADAMREKFAALPQKLEPEKPLSDSAQAVLVLVFSKELAAFRNQVALGKVRGELELPLFMVFGKAQSEATKAKEANISVGRIIGSLFWWWTSVWPFCD